MTRICMLLAVSFFVSCTQKPVFQHILTSNNLVAQSFEINPSRDTVIVGIRGGRITIPAGAFAVPAGQKVTITVKEAYSARDILLAGLATETNGRPLRSGGMIYMDASSDGKKVEIAKPINVAIPTDNYQNGMSLYNGEMKPDSTLNWIKPINLDSFSIARGEMRFKQNCANCHKPKSDYTGPALASCLEREPYPDWGYRFTTGYFSDKPDDPYLKELKRKWNNSVMTIFNLSRQDYYDIMKYVYAVSDSTKPVAIPNVAGPAPKLDGPISPCDTATVLVQTVYDTIYTDPRNYDLPVAPYLDTIPNNDTQPIKPGRSKASDAEGLRNGFTDGAVGSGMYNFEIQTLGWFNVDVEVEGYEGTSLIKLTGTIEVAEKMNITLYLFCPLRKMLSVGTVGSDNKFSFDKIDGTIPLFKGDDCILIAFGSYKTQLYLGSTAFTVRGDETQTIKMLPVAEAAFYKMIRDNNINGIDIRCKKLEEKVVPRPVDLPCGDSLPKQPTGTDMMKK